MSQEQTHKHIVSYSQTAIFSRIARLLFFLFNLGWERLDLEILNCNFWFQHFSFSGMIIDDDDYQLRF